MEFAKRMDCFGEGIFSKLAEIRKRKEGAGEEVIDLSIGAKGAMGWSLIRSGRSAPFWVPRKGWPISPCP